MYTALMGKNKKSTTLTLRISLEDKEVLVEASKRSGRSVNSLFARTVVERAEAARKWVKDNPA
jgi:uncharacterized protein (DUF1778 family)